MKKPLQILIFLFIGFSEINGAENYPTGARAIGLSNAFVSISDTWSTFHNQATLASLNTFSTGVFYESRFGIDELSLAAGTIILPTNSGAFGFSIYQFGKGTYKEHKVGLAYARQLSERLNAAVQLDYFSQRFPENSGAYGFATFECGVTFKTTEHLTLGAHVFNPVKNGFNMPEGKQKMSAIYRFGGHYIFSDMVLITAEAQKKPDYPLVLKTGLEFEPVKNLALRFGVSGRPVQYTAGIGYRVKEVTTNIAFSYHTHLGFTPSVSLQFDLK